MSSWFVDEEHPVQDVVQHRLCVDSFLGYVFNGLALATCQSLLAQATCLSPLALPA